MITVPTIQHNHSKTPVSSPELQSTEFKKTTLTCESDKSTSATTSTRRVRFQNTVAVRFTQCRADRQDELPLMHYGSDEYKTMKRNAAALAEQIHCQNKGSRGTTVSAKEELRGLENLYRSGARKRQLSKLEGWRSVMTEQRRQEHAGIYPIDYDAIAAQYRPVAKRTLQEAKERGHQDALALQRILIEDSNSMTRSMSIVSSKSSSSSSSRSSTDSESEHDNDMQLETSSEGNRGWRNSHRHQQNGANGLKKLLRWRKNRRASIR